MKKSAADKTGTQEVETTEALRRLGVVSLTLLTFMLLSYMIPAMGRFRPWIPGQELPFASLFTTKQEIPTFAGAGEGYGKEASTEEIAENLGAAVAANLGEKDPAPVKRNPSASFSISEDEYAGIEMPIKNVEALDDFYAHLLKTVSHKGQIEDGKQVLTRVAHYGDSSIATDLITSTIRRRLQTRMGDGGHGFVLISKGYLPYRHRDLHHKASDGWMLREIVRNHDPEGLYGFGGVQFRGKPRSWASFGTDDDSAVGREVSRFSVFYQKHKRGGRIWLELDKGPRQTIETREPETLDAVHHVDAPQGAHRLLVKFGGGGQPRLYGVALETKGPGVVYDSLGLVGARASRLLNYNAEHIKAQLAARNTNLVILGFGGNEASDNISKDNYQATFVKVIKRMRAGTDMPCLVFAPLDQAKRDKRGKISTMETIPSIVAGQEAAARAEGCAFFDTWNAMGGEGAMRRWHKARPRLAMADFRHATPAGYEVIGNMFYKALMKGFAEYLERKAKTEADESKATQ